MSSFWESWVIFILLFQLSLWDWIVLELSIFINQSDNQRDLDFFLLFLWTKRESGESLRYYASEYEVPFAMHRSFQFNKLILFQVNIVSIVLVQSKICPIQSCRQCQLSPCFWCQSWFHSRPKVDQADNAKTNFELL